MTVLVVYCFEVIDITEEQGNWVPAIGFLKLIGKILCEIPSIQKNARKRIEYAFSFESITKLFYPTQATVLRCMPNGSGRCMNSGSTTCRTAGSMSEAAPFCSHFT